MSAGSGTTMHHVALQRLADQIAAPLAGGAAGGAGPLDAWRKRSVRLRQFSDQQKQEEIFQDSVTFLMESDTWTFGNMAAYQRKVLELAGGTSWRRRFSQDDPSLLHLEKELRIMEAMTPSELMSNHKSVFTTEAKKMIAEKAGVSQREVDNVIMNHDILRADRRWYQILRQFNRPMPKSFEDRQYMGEYDRPFSESEKEFQEDMMEKHRRDSRKQPPRLFNVFYRQPSCGGNRWSTRPPKWYPAQWRVRQQRQGRLAGVGAGGGGDRGRPWGRLAQHAGTSGAQGHAR